MENITVPFSALIVSDLNVRKTNADISLDALAANILEHGLIQPLVVTALKTRKATAYVVHAGGRRCRAIGKPVEEGKLADDHGVEVRVFPNRAAAGRRAARTTSQCGSSSCSRNCGRPNSLFGRRRHRRKRIAKVKARPAA
jgi:hypothetical protein